LQRAFRARNLTDIIDIVFVSDHGMTDTSNPELIYMDDILGEEGLKAIAHEDGWPSMGLRFHENANASHYLDALLNAAYANPEKFHVYTHDTMPKRYHFTKHERIAPIYVVPNIGYVLTTKAEGNVGMNKGVCFSSFFNRIDKVTYWFLRIMGMTTMPCRCRQCSLLTGRSLST
jgi:predicted AlkP superfamily pyrophosphatase or phosphodiesterase